MYQRSKMIGIKPCTLNPDAAGRGASRAPDGWKRLI
jgi:hypothetical protein